MLPNTILKLVIDRWIQDGDNGAQFLIKVATGRYSLGAAYKKESDFLMLQGELRKTQKKRAEAGVRKRRQNRSK